MSPRSWYVAWVDEIDKGGGDSSSRLLFLFWMWILGWALPTSLTPSVRWTIRRVLSFGQPIFWDFLQELLSLRGWV